MFQQKFRYLFCFLNGLNLYYVIIYLQIPIPMLLAKRIASVRSFLGITQNQMAIKLDIEQSTYSGYEREAGNLKFITIVKIAEAFGCSIPFLTDIYSNEADESKWREQLGKQHKQTKRLSQKLKQPLCLLEE